MLSNGKVLIDLTVSDARALSQALKELADKIEKGKGMTTYSLRNEGRQKHFEAIWPDFKECLQYACEAVQTTDSVCVKLCTDTVWFDWDEIKASKPYNPSGWNIYPDVTPPERQVMIIESQNTKTGLTMIYSAYFEDGKWVICNVEMRGDACPVSPANRVIRFRPLYP